MFKQIRRSWNELHEPKSLTSTFWGIRHPFRGIWVTFCTEGSFRVEVGCFFAAIALLYFRDASLIWWMFAGDGFKSVFSNEHSNTAHELDQRLSHPRTHEVVVEPTIELGRPLRNWVRFLEWLSGGRLQRPDEARVELVSFTDPEKASTVRNIYDVASAQVFWPIVYTASIMVAAITWPHPHLW